VPVELLVSSCVVVMDMIASDDVVLAA
jgi:hypothetical protein